MQNSPGNQGVRLNEIIHHWLTDRLKGAANPEQQAAYIHLAELIRHRVHEMIGQLQIPHPDLFTDLWREIEEHPDFQRLPERDRTGGFERAFKGVQAGVFQRNGVRVTRIDELPQEAALDPTIAEKGFELVLSNLSLPDGDSFVALKIAREIIPRASTPALLVNIGDAVKAHDANLAAMAYNKAWERLKLTDLSTEEIADLYFALGEKLKDFPWEEAAAICKIILARPKSDSLLGQLFSQGLQIHKKTGDASIVAEAGKRMIALMDDSAELIELVRPLMKAKESCHLSIAMAFNKAMEKADYDHLVTIGHLARRVGNSTANMIALDAYRAASEKAEGDADRLLALSQWLKSMGNAQTSGVPDDLPEVIRDIHGRALQELDRKRVLIKLSVSSTGAPIPFPPENASGADPELTVPKMLRLHPRVAPSDTGIESVMAHIDQASGKKVMGVEFSLAAGEEGSWQALPGYNPGDAMVSLDAPAGSRVCFRTVGEGEKRGMPSDIVEVIPVYTTEKPEQPRVLSVVRSSVTPSLAAVQMELPNPRPGKALFYRGEHDDEFNLAPQANKDGTVSMELTPGLYVFKAIAIADKNTVCFESDEIQVGIANTLLS